MKVYVSGDEPSDRKVTFALLERATEFMVERLFHHDDANDLVGQLDIQIGLEHGLFERTNNDALMYSEIGNTGVASDFEVYIDASLSYELTLKALAHELAHVRQYALGLLSYSNGVYRWNGMVVDEEKYDYYDLPWEIAAHGCEYGLYARFIKHLEGSNTQTSKNIAAAQLLISTLTNLKQSGQIRSQ